MKSNPKYRILLFILAMILMILYHLYIVQEMKQDEQKLIDAFRSGQFDQFQKTKQEWFNEK